VNDRKRAARAPGQTALSGGSLALFSGGSVITSGGGLVAQIAGHVGSAALVGIYGSAALIAAVGSITAIVKIVAERSPEIRKARALAKIVEKMSGQDGGKLLILDRCLEKEEITASQVLEALNLIFTSTTEEQRRDPKDAKGPPKVGKTIPNLISIYSYTRRGAMQASLN
jgi:hypothetical protein